MAIILREVRSEDRDMLFAWQTPEARRYFINSKRPSLLEHQQWFATRFAKDEPWLWIIELSDIPAGYIRLDACPEYDGAMVSILVDREYQGRGAATEALRLLRHMLPDLCLWAEIHAENIASRKSFKNAGFREVSPCLMVNQPSDASHADASK